MSTRATYRIQEGDSHSDETQCFYVHHDGYPEGAADKFRDMKVNLETLIGGKLGGDSRCRPGKPIIAFGMIDGAQFTKDHEVHGDTEYCYNIYFNRKDQKFSLRAYELDFDGGSQLFFNGELDEFIKKYLGDE
jgi:hypothetical protein